MEEDMSGLVDIRGVAKKLNEVMRIMNILTPARDDGALTCRIPRVDERTRELDGGSYNPQLVVIGPYNRHYGTADKIRSLSHAVSVSKRRGVVLENLLEAVARLAGLALRCYVQGVEMTVGQFAEMLLVDGCYLHLRFVDVTSGASGGTVQEDNRGVPVVAERDVFCLAENQIPFFVVEKLFELITGNSDPDVVVRTFASRIQIWLQKKNYTRTTVFSEPPQRPAHPLHLLHMYFSPSTLPESGDSSGEPTGIWHRATEYEIAGVSFKKRTLDGLRVCCVLDVLVDAGTVEAPCLTVNRDTCTVLRNLMAMEQSNRQLRSHATAYCIFLSQIACKADDVALLSRNGIIVNQLGNDDELARWFANLRRGVDFDADDLDRNYLRPVWQAMENRYNNPVFNWMAWLRHKYFSNPWLAMQLAAASVLLLCTMVQAVYAVLSYKKGPN